MIAALLLFFVLPVLPDNKLTPGVIGETDAAKVCVPYYSQTIRHTSKKLKLSIFAEYHADPKSSGPVEIDHRVPLLLGGADVRANLWPQSYMRYPYGAHAKDALEVRIQTAVCSHHTLSLKAAQKIFLGNWVAAYQHWFPTNATAQTPEERHMLTLMPEIQ